MCDTIVATSDATLDGIPLFGKNSDREPNEAQFLDTQPPQEHPEGANVRCTFIEIPQVSHTHGVVLSRPFWMWGAEMGMNEFGLAIGNEAVFTKEKTDKTGGLTGMDLVRLALERSRNSREGVAVITDLLETHGQGGNCGYSKPFYYHNSFLLSDPEGAWILETAGRHWAAKEIRGVYAISNALTIGSDWDLASRDLVSNAVKKGWCRSESDFSFARCYSAKFYTAASCARKRQGRATTLLEGLFPELRPIDMASILRDHGLPRGQHYKPDRGFIHSSICNHTGFGPIRISQTTGSLICRLSRKNPTVFATATAAPCTSIFKPIWVDTPLSVDLKIPSGTWDADSLFWTHEILHRMTLRDYAPLISLYEKERDRLENSFMIKALSLRESDIQSRAAFVQACWSSAKNAEIEWTKSVKHACQHTMTGRLYSGAWRDINRQAEMSGILFA